MEPTIDIDAGLVIEHLRARISELEWQLTLSTVRDVQRQRDEAQAKAEADSPVYVPTEPPE